MRAAWTVLMAVLCLGTSGCWFGKKGGAQINAPVLAQPVAGQPVANPAPPPVEPAPKETPPSKPAARRNPVPATPPASAPAAAPVAPAPPPALREIISGEQRRQYEAEFAQGVVRAGEVLKQASARTLNAGQQETAARIRTFLAQATAMRADDISTALQLARRADLLGQELLKSFK